MLHWLNQNIGDPLVQILGGTLVFLFTNFTTVLGFVLALLIIRRVLEEKRSPSSFFAWFFLVIFFPLLGVPLYFLLGGRKSRRLANSKRQITKEAENIAEESTENKPHQRAKHPLTKGNHFELLPDGVAGFNRLCAEIEQAEHTIHIATYILGNDTTGNAIVERLVKRAEDGVTVRLLLDSLGSWNCTRRARLKIRQAGGEVAMFMPVLPFQTHMSANLRNHRKIAIFDNYRAITGGQNIDTRFMGSDEDPDRFTDFSIVTQGPAVASLTRIFLSDWVFARKELPAKHADLLKYVPEEAGDSTTEIITGGPDTVNDPIWEHIVRVIQECKQQLTLITPYFIPDEVIFRSLIIKAHTGRKIRLIIPLHSNQKLTDIARHHYLRQLDAAGVEILLFKPRMMHGKLIIADGKLAMTGSANVDMRSLFVNFEIAQFHYTARDVAKLQEWADSLLPGCIPYKEAIQDPRWVPSRSKENLVNLLVPLL